MKFKAILFLLLTLNAHAFLGDSLNLPPQASYKTVESENFIVIYPEKFATEARHSLTVFENAHRTLAPFFQYSPRSKMVAILADNEDFANGVTTAIGRQGIVLYMTSPDPYVSIGEYGHWLNNLIIHEYTHYITLERADGFFKALRILFGDLIQPNHLWPTWLAEGLAVYSESHFTEQGRGNGTYYATLTRDSLFHETIRSFDDLSGPRPEYPFGEILYYSGYAIVEQMAKELDESSLGRFTQESSARVAYFLNGTLDNIAKPGQTNQFRELWQNFFKRKRKEMSAELDWIKANPTANFKKYSREKDRAVGARLSADGSWLAYFNQSGSEASNLKLVNLSNEKTVSLDMLATGAGLSFSKDSKKLYYAKTDYRSAFNFYSDLYSIELDSHHIERLTFNERAKDPDVCGESKLVFVSRSGRFSEIKMLDLDGSKISSVYKAKEYFHVSNPKCSADGKEIYFSMHSTSPLDAIYKIAIEGSNEPKRILGGTNGENSGFRALFANPAKDGTIYFTRDQDSFFSLAKYDVKTAKVETLARSSGGFWLPDVVNDRIAFTYVDSTASYASVGQLSDFKTVKIEKNRSIEKKTENKIEPVETIKEYQTEEKNYHFYSSILPRFWFPILTYSRSRTQLGLGITGWDDVDQFEYSLSAYYDSIPRSVLGSFATQHRIGPLHVSPFVNASITSLYYDKQERLYYTLERNTGIFITRPIPSTFSRIEPYVLGIFARTNYDGALGKQVSDPEIRVGTGVIFDSRLRFATSIAAEKGRLVSLDAREYFTNHARAYKIGGRFNQLVPFYPMNSSLSAALFAARTDRIQSEIAGANVRVGGRADSMNLDLPLRGYPQGTFKSEQAVSGQFEYRLPISQIFTGYDTWPIFMKNLGVYGFFDSAKMILDYGNRANQFTAPVNGIGAGLLLNTEIGYYSPLHIVIEYANGLNHELGGEESAALYLSL